MTTSRPEDPQDVTDAAKEHKNDDTTRAFSKEPKTSTKTNPTPINTVFHLELNKEDQQSLLAAKAENPEFKGILKKLTTPFKMDGCLIIKYVLVCITKSRFRDDVLRRPPSHGGYRRRP